MNWTAINCKLAQLPHPNTTNPTMSMDLSEHGDGTRRRAHATLDIERSTREEESPPSFFLAHFAQSLEIPHLPDRSSPLRQQPFVQTPTSLHWWRPRLESNCISYHRREVPVVQPTDCRLVVLQPDSRAVLLRAVLSLFRRRVVVPAHVAAADAEDVALPESRSLPSKALFDLRDGDLVPADCRWWVAVFLFVPWRAS
jgi:hypothetical protein